MNTSSIIIQAGSSAEGNSDGTRYLSYRHIARQRSTGGNDERITAVLKIVSTAVSNHSGNITIKLFTQSEADVILSIYLADGSRAYGNTGHTKGAYRGRRQQQAAKQR
ncbi:hypothetical protein ES703_87123 [subsurface metagenome]